MVDRKHAGQSNKGILHSQAKIVFMRHEHAKTPEPIPYCMKLGALTVSATILSICRAVGTGVRYTGTQALAVT